MDNFWGRFSLCISFSVIIYGVKSTKDCPTFVCPTVYDDIAHDEIQLEARPVSRPPIVDLQQYGIDENGMEHWSCERPNEEIRLGWNDYSHGEGRVEIFYFNQWGTVCNTTWDMTGANVVCRQLGFLRAYDSVNADVFGPTSGPVWLSNTDCSGDEESLYRCRKDGIGQNQCGHETDAAIVCDLTGQLIVSTIGQGNQSLLYSNTSDSPGFHSSGALVDIPAITMHYHKEQNTLYWIQDVDGVSNCELRRMVLNGSNQVELFESVTACSEYSSVVVDDVTGYVYWTESGVSRRVKKKSIKGLDQVVELHRYSVSISRTILIRNATRQLYVLRRSRIEQWNMAYTARTDIVLFSTSETVNCLTLDEPGGMMYYVDTPGVIKMADIDGGEVMTQFVINETPSSMVFASGWLVYVEPIARRVARIALRGSSKEIVYQDIGNGTGTPSGLAFISYV